MRTDMKVQALFKAVQLCKSVKEGVRSIPSIMFVKLIYRCYCTGYRAIGN